MAKYLSFHKQGVYFAISTLQNWVFLHSSLSDIYQIYKTGVCCT
jgi:hypothetical protein